MFRTSVVSDTHLQLWSASPQGRADYSLYCDRDMLWSCECFHLSHCHLASHFQPSFLSATFHVCVCFNLIPYIFCFVSFFLNIYCWANSSTKLSKFPLWIFLLKGQPALSALCPNRMFMSFYLRIQSLSLILLLVQLSDLPSSLYFLSPSLFWL